MTKSNMNRNEIVTFVSIFLVMMISTGDSVEYFIYMPNTIVSNSVHNVPVYLSHPPAIISFSYPSKFDPIQRFLLIETLNDVSLEICNSNISATVLPIQITLSTCGSIEDCYTNQTLQVLTSKTYQIPLSKKSHLIQLATSKGCYSSSEKLLISVIIIRIEEILNRKFSNVYRIEWENGRFVPKTRLYSKLKPKSEILKLTLSDTNNITIKSWSKNSEDKSFNVEYILPKDSVSGTWKIAYQLSNTNQQDFHEFELRSEDEKPVNAKMNICIKYNGDITIMTRNIQFFVCAEYSKFRSVKGKLSGTICLKYPEEELTTERPCLTFESYMNGSSKCVWIETSTDGLQLKNISYSQRLSRLIISVDIIDEYSKKNHLYHYMGPTLKNSKYKISFLSSPYFKSMLPYYGRIQTLQHNDKPFSNASIVIQCNTVNFPYNWGHYSKHVSDKDGNIYFILSSPPVNLEIITCDIEDLSFTEEKSIHVRYYRSSITQTLERSKSSKKKNIQLKLLDRKMLIKNQELIKLELQSNNVVTEDLMILLVGNGQIIKSKYIKNSHLPKTVCHTRNDELGHYVCDNLTKKMSCMENWTGNNCLTPKCKADCNNGICVQINHCFCKYGWTGKYCNKCVTSKDCLNGACVEGNDCICSAGWIGSNCDIEGTYLQNQTKLHRKLVKKSIPIKEIKTTEINLIFTAIINLKIPSMMSAVTVIVHSVSKSPSSSKLLLEPIYSFIKDNIGFGHMKTQNCIHYDQYQPLKATLGGITAIDPKNIPIQNSIYNEIAIEQCTIPFNEVPNFSKVQLNTNIVTQFSPAENDDFLNVFQSLNLFPITTLKIVSRTCPLWKIISTINKTNALFPKTRTIYVTQNPTQNIKKNNRYRNCQCEADCNNVYSEMFQINQSVEPVLVSSLCVDSSKTKKISVINHLITIKPSFLVTISTINYLKIHEIHHQIIEIFNLLRSDLEIEIISKSRAKCLVGEFNKTIIIKIKPQQTFKVVQDVQFNCPGIFQIFFHFQTKHSNRTFPSISNDTVSYPIKRTEKILYKVYNVTLFKQTNNYQYCRNEIKNSSVSIEMFKEPYVPSYVSFKIQIQSGLERFLEYLRYIYQNQNLDNIVTLTMRIYELNLTKYLKNKKFLNHSLISIKKMIEVESKVFKSIQRSLPFDYAALLLNLCTDIPNHLYNIKRKFCKLLENKLILSQFNENNCTDFRGKFDEIVFLASISLTKESKYFQSKNKTKFNFIQSCLMKSNSGPESKIYLNHIENVMKNDSHSLKNWLNINENSLNLNQLAFLSIITKDNPKFNPIRNRTVKKILQKISNNPKGISKIKAIVLLKVLAENEENLPNSFHFGKSNQTTAESTKEFSDWSKYQKLSVELPKYFSCSNIKVESEYFTEIFNGKINDDFIDLEEKSNDCNSTELFLTVKNQLKNLKSIIIHLPTGWMIEKLTIDSISTQLLPCNIFLKNKNDLFQVEFDFYLALTECHINKIPLKLFRYQAISNLQPSYATITNEKNVLFHKKFSIKYCPKNYPPLLRNQFKTLHKLTTIKELCDKYQEILIKFNDTFLTIEDRKIIIKKTKESLVDNKILFLNKEKSAIEKKINTIFQWFLRNSNLESCENGQIIRNLLNSHSNWLTAPENRSNCVTIELDLVTNESFYQIICRKLINVYSIRSIDLNKNSITLKQLIEPCNVKSKLKSEFKIDFIVDYSCESLKKISKFSKESFLFLSILDLQTARNPLKLNNKYLLVTMENI